MSDIMPATRRASGLFWVARLAKFGAFVTGVPYCSAFAQTPSQATGLVGLDTLNVKTTYRRAFCLANR